MENGLYSTIKSLVEDSTHIIELMNIRDLLENYDQLTHPERASLVEIIDERIEIITGGK